MIGNEHFAVFGFFKFVFLIFLIKGIFFFRFGGMRHNYHRNRYYRSQLNQPVRNNSEASIRSDQESFTQRGTVYQPRRDFNETKVDPQMNLETEQSTAYPSEVDGSSTVFCVECGLKINQKYKFCPVCGQSNAMK